VTGSAGIDGGAASGQLAVRDLDLRRFVADLRQTRLAGTFAGRMRVDTADADGEISGDLRQSDMALAFRAAVARGVIDVRTFRAQARSRTLQGTASFAIAVTKPSSGRTVVGLNPASFGNYPVASLSGKASAQGALKPAWSVALSFELGHDSSLRGRPLAGTGKLALAPGSVRDAHVAFRAGAEKGKCDGDVCAPATCSVCAARITIPPRSMNGSVGTCAPRERSPAHGTGRHSPSPPLATAFASALNSPRRRSPPKERSAPAPIVRFGLRWRQPRCTPRPLPRAPSAPVSMARSRITRRRSMQQAMPPMPTSS
jgi:hypothetical protein